MLVILADEQILPTRQVCQGCLLATQQGLPRWHHGKLNCGYALNRSENYQAMIYECQMGFRLADIQ